MMLRISLGLLGAGSRPAATRTFCASGIVAILAISALSLTTRSSGVPRGANSASHEGALKLGTPDSRSVGMFGMDCERTGSATPKAITWPLLIIGRIEAVSNNPKGTTLEQLSRQVGRRAASRNGVAQGLGFRDRHKIGNRCDPRLGVGGQNDRAVH